MHSTNFVNTFIQISEDCPTDTAEIPPLKSQKSVVNYQFEFIERKPYFYSSDDLIFSIHAIRNGIKNTTEERELFFAKGQPCMRTSALGKRYGWGIHYNEEGKMALVPFGSALYEKMLVDQNLKQMRAMRSKRA